MNRHPSVNVLASETLFRGPVFDVVRESVELPSGLRQELALVDHPGAVCIAPLLQDGRLLCVRQYRHAAGDWLVEIPAGRLERGEQPLDAARRELEEETGQRAQVWQHVCEFFAAPGFCSERLWLFVARGLATATDARRCDADEELELVPLAPAELLAGRARDAKTLLAAALIAAKAIG